jgi:hypothetical protein
MSPSPGGDRQQRKEGSHAMHRRIEATAPGLLCLCLLVSGCAGDGPAPAPPETPTAQASSRFDSSAAGTVGGQVVWEGDLPSVAPFDIPCNPPYGPPLEEDYTRPNPNAPVIDARGRGVADVVVFLSGVAPEKARPWDLGPVRVEQRGGRIHVLQDGADSRAGFVRRGEAVTLTSRDAYYHALAGSGGAFFTLAFPDPDRPLKRRFPRSGTVELASGAGYFWMRGYLFVDDHPYYARTDARGRFVLRDVPAGRYRLACWHPNWVEAGHDRDPESALITRLTFRPPVVLEKEVEVAPGRTTSVQFGLSARLFVTR